MPGSNPSAEKAIVTGPMAELIEKARRWPRDGFGERALFNELTDELKRLWGALQMIAEETVCPELWRPADRAGWSERELAHRTALVIARAAIEGKFSNG